MVARQLERVRASDNGGEDGDPTLGRVVLCNSSEDSNLDYDPATGSVHSFLAWTGTVRNDTRRMYTARDSRGGRRLDLTETRTTGLPVWGIPDEPLSNCWSLALDPSGTMTVTHREEIRLEPPREPRGDRAVTWGFIGAACGAVPVFNTLAHLMGAYLTISGDGTRTQKAVGVALGLLGIGASLISVASANGPLLLPLAASAALGAVQGFALEYGHEMALVRESEARYQEERQKLLSDPNVREV
ncbi:MAG: hypothetical protein AB1758_36785 [Candidatus Eremiobacterota bacterium]